MIRSCAAHAAVVILIVGALACGGRDRRGGIALDSGPRADAAPASDAGSRDAFVPRTDAAAPRDGGGTGTDAGGDPGSDTRYFVPDVPSTYTGTLSDPGIDILAHTVREDPLGGLEFLMAIRNTYGSPLCTIRIENTFLDATGSSIGSSNVTVEGSPHRGSSGTGGLVPGCVSHGQVAMGSYILDLFGSPEDIASITWTVSALNLTDAVPTSDLAVTGVSAVDDGTGRRQFVGTFRNYTTTTLTYPSVTIFGLNAVGRPLFATSDIDSASVPPSGSWSFQTTPRFSETFADYAAFPDAND